MFHKVRPDWQTINSTLKFIDTEDMHTRARSKEGLNLEELHNLISVRKRYHSESYDKFYVLFLWLPELYALEKLKTSHCWMDLLTSVLAVRWLYRT